MNKRIVNPSLVIVPICLLIFFLVVKPDTAETNNLKKTSISKNNFNDERGYFNSKFSLSGIGFYYNDSIYSGESSIFIDGKREKNLSGKFEYHNEIVNDIKFIDGMVLKGSTVSKNGKDGFIGMGLILDKNSLKKLRENNIIGIRFRAYTNNYNYRCMLNMEDLDASKNYHGMIFSTKDKVQNLYIPFSVLEQEKSNGKSVKFDKNKVSRVTFQIDSKAPANVELIVSNLELINNETEEEIKGDKNMRIIDEEAVRKIKKEVEKEEKEEKVENNEKEEKDESKNIENNAENGSEKIEGEVEDEQNEVIEEKTSEEILRELKISAIEDIKIKGECKVKVEYSGFSDNEKYFVYVFARVKETSDYWVTGTSEDGYEIEEEGFKDFSCVAFPMDQICELTAVVTKEELELASRQSVFPEDAVISQTNTVDPR